MSEAMGAIERQRQETMLARAESKKFQDALLISQVCYFLPLTMTFGTSPLNFSARFWGRFWLLFPLQVDVFPFLVGLRPKSTFFLGRIATLQAECSRLFLLSFFSDCDTRKFVFGSDSDVATSEKSGLRQRRR